MTDLRSRFGILRCCAREISDDTWAGPNPFGDEFWRSMDQIEAAGSALDENSADWLAGFTQIDDISNPADWFLATAALASIAEMPRAAFAAACRIQESLPDDASTYRKVGLCKLFEASGLPDGMPFVDRYLSDPDSYVRSEAASVARTLAPQQSEDPSALNHQP